MQNEWRFFRRNGEDSDHIFTTAIEHCIYSLHDLQRLMVRGGWSVVEAFGGFKMDPPSIDSPTQLVVGRGRGPAHALPPLLEHAEYLPAVFEAEEVAAGASLPELHWR